MMAVDEADLIDPQRLAECVIDDVIINARKPKTERRALTLRELRTAVEFEAQIICVAAANVAQGIELSPADVGRVWLARDRILWLWDKGLAR